MASNEEKSINKFLNNVEFGKFPYDKNYQVKIEAGKQQGKSFRAGMEFSNKIWKEKIKNYINIIQKELDKYKIKNTNTYIQIEGNPEINGLLIQKATLEELIKEE